MALELLAELPTHAGLSERLGAALDGPGRQQDQSDPARWWPEGSIELDLAGSMISQVGKGGKGAPGCLGAALDGPDRWQDRLG
jgi:hypothetical protein